jgi:hypothetical protein
MQSLFSDQFVFGQRRLILQITPQNQLSVCGQTSDVLLLEFAELVFDRMLLFGRFFLDGRSTFSTPSLFELSKIPGVAAVVLGGSYARRTARPDSDLDVGLYYSKNSPPDIEAILRCAETIATPNTPQP